MNVGTYKLSDVPSHFDEWEFIHAEILIRPTKKINILDIGSGKMGMTYAVCAAMRDQLNSIYSIDFKNEVEKDVENPLFYCKKKVFTTLHNGGCSNINTSEVRRMSSDERERLVDFLKKVGEIDIVMLEFINSEKFMDDTLSYIGDIISGATILHYDYLESDGSEDYFNSISKDKKTAKFSNTKGIGLIYDF